MEVQAATMDVDDTFRDIFSEPAIRKAPGRLLPAADGHVHKDGPRVRKEEGEAQIFAQSLGLPVPSILRIDASDESTTIVMEHIDGERLDDCWSEMTELQKQAIVLALRQILAIMRQAAPTQDYIGGFGGPVKDCRIFGEYTGGPFHKREDFEHWTLDLLSGTPKAIRNALQARAGTHGRLVFTHGDLSPRNIVVKDGKIQALLDWEYAGWFPEHWEYIKFFDRPTSCKGWLNTADEIFETPYPDELVTHQALLRWQHS